MYRYLSINIPINWYCAYYQNMQYALLLKYELQRLPAFGLV